MNGSISNNHNLVLDNRSRKVIFKGYVNANNTVDYTSEGGFSLRVDFEYALDKTTANSVI